MSNKKLKTLEDIEKIYEVGCRQVHSVVIPVSHGFAKSVASEDLRSMALEWIKAIEKQEIIFGGLISTKLNKQELEEIRKKVEEGAIKLINHLFNLGE